MESLEEGTILDQYKKYQNSCMCEIDYFVMYVNMYLLFVMMLN